MSQAVSALWLRLATLESNHRQWTEGLFLYQSSAERRGVGLVFRTEFPQTVNSVDSIEIDNVRATDEQLALRSDNHTVALATLSGALAGAVVGAVASLAGLVIAGA